SPPGETPGGWRAGRPRATSAALAAMSSTANVHLPRIEHEVLRIGQPQLQRRALDVHVVHAGARRLHIQLVGPILARHRALPGVPEAGRLYYERGDIAQSGALLIGADVEEPEAERRVAPLWHHLRAVEILHGDAAEL